MADTKFETHKIHQLFTNKHKLQVLDLYSQQITNQH